jgi:hypothetical protein
MSSTVIRAAGGLAETRTSGLTQYLSSAITLKSAQTEGFSADDTELKAGAIAEGFVVV